MAPGDITFQIGPGMMPLLVPALDGCFFVRDDLASGPWNETLKQAEWRRFFPGNNSSGDFGHSPVLNFLLVRYRDSMNTDEYIDDARSHLEAIVSDVGVLIADRSINQIDWLSITTLLFKDYEEQLSPSKSVLLGPVHFAYADNISEPE